MAPITRLAAAKEAAREARREARRAKKEARRAEQARTGLTITLPAGSGQNKATSPAPKISLAKQKVLATAENPTIMDEVEEEIDEWEIPASYILARTPEWKPLKILFNFSMKKMSGGV
ncbi:hypothetical protein OCU04_006456 [Sclerotinia nivalis]|uniref:Uncharacterized protein n=1 Tax=Sclerotinia nivalis TaxID=352851 RepID=A0A9X0DM92_9HELO|nr:hypothetical protein OCU04_006456 [Sclerotinia nivalis]